MQTIGANPYQVQVPPGAYRSTALTQPIHKDEARFRILSCGRRFGKSWFAMCEGFLMSLDVVRHQHRTPDGLVVAPTYDMVEKDWRISQELFAANLTEVSESRKTLTLGPLGRIEYRSTEAQGGVGRGGGYDWMVLDEAAKIPRPAWEEDLRPALSDRAGRMVAISTPHRRNFFYDLYRKGCEERQTAYRSWQFSTMEGWRARFAKEPERLKAAEAEWEQVVKDTPSNVFAQEYLGEFLENEGTMWRLDKLLRGHLRGPIQGRHYVAGVDVAHVNDWMATVVIERESRQVVALHRSRYRDWLIQKAEVLMTLAPYPNCQVLIDATGLGDPVAQDLQRAGLALEYVVFSPNLKKALVRNLSLAIDHGYLGCPDEPRTAWLKDELLAYKEEKLASGDFRYGAPEGEHDDGVTALTLAAWPLRWEWQIPAIDSVVAPAPDDEWLRGAKRFTAQAAAWRRAYPTRPIPQSRYDLAWEELPRWHRYMEWSA